MVTIIHIGTYIIVFHQVAVIVVLFCSLYNYVLVYGFAIKICITKKFIEFINLLSGYMGFTFFFLQ